MGSWILHSTGTSNPGLVFMVGGREGSSKTEPIILPVGVEPDTGKQLNGSKSGV